MHDILEHWIKLHVYTKNKLVTVPVFPIVTIENSLNIIPTRFFDFVCLKRWTRNARKETSFCYQHIVHVTEFGAIYWYS